MFSVFESWYVKQHVDVLKLNPDWMAKTFSTSTFANGILAILAGVVSNFVAETLNVGPIAPFLIAVPVLITCFLVVLFTWEENYGNQVWHEI